MSKKDKKEKRKLVLASTSKVRQMLLNSAGIKFTSVSPVFDEREVEISDPVDLVQVLAYGKARSVADSFTESIIIGSDTVISFRGEILGKPYTDERAFEMLKSLQGEWNVGYTGLSLIDTLNGKEWRGYSETRVKIRSLSDEEINAYIKSGEPLNKAGAYSEMKGSMLIEAMDGDIFSVQGLPLQLMAKILLQEFEYQYWNDWF